MTRFVVQRGPCDYVAVEASSPRAAANKVVGNTRGVIVWYRASSSWASWADAEQGRTRYLGKIDERVAALLNPSAANCTVDAARGASRQLLDRADRQAALAELGLTQMAAGDAQRVWFPEMLDDLRAFWSASRTWDELAGFCQRMTGKRLAIREARGVLPPRTRCPRCGVVSRSDIPAVSVRSALFALKKLGIVTETGFKDLDRSWKKHRAAAGVDAYGCPAAPPADAGDEPPVCC